MSPEITQLASRDLKDALLHEHMEPRHRVIRSLKGHIER
jgi:hypothetical protein